MQLYFKREIINWKNNWRTILIRFVIYIVGVYLFGLGIALYMNTRVGASQVDITNFAFLGVLINITKTGENKGALGPDELSHYSYFLMIFYVCMFGAATIMRIINVIIKYRHTKENNVIMEGIVYTVLDLIPLFVWAYFVQLNLLFLGGAVGDRISHMGILERTWIFMAAFIIYCFGIAFAVYANMLFGPYNALSMELHRLTKMNYKLARVIADLCLALVGIILILACSWSWDLKLAFFSNYLGFGTIFMTFISGPIIGVILTYMHKFIKLDRLTKPTVVINENNE
ncbi:SPE_1075/MLC_0560 family membrane protein [Spiroplasma sp. DGKH1]|uniref:SPE_1075/MLC_0560 family membrane protein n=1 Tax=Spiroplasma sp. DGKH1 TaxID=3050074 RepID=UPI0034C61F87